MFLKAYLGVRKTFDKTAILETMMTDTPSEGMYLLDVEVSLAVPAEQIDGKNLLIRKLRIELLLNLWQWKRREDLWTSQIYIYKPISINFFSLGKKKKKMSGFILLIY